MLRYLLYSIQNNYVEPHFVVDVSKYIDVKINAINCFKSQFYDPHSTEPETPISTANFLNSIKARSISLGRYIHADYGEGFTAERFIGTEDLTSLI